MVLKGAIVLSIQGGPGARGLKGPGYSRGPGSQGTEGHRVLNLQSGFWGLHPQTPAVIPALTVYQLYKYFSNKTH